jgi:hypothetical protein
MTAACIDNRGARRNGIPLDPFDAERLRGLLEQTTDRKERARLRGLLQFASPEKRKAHGALTQQRMKDPAVRQRVRDGTAQARAAAPQLIVLREAWKNALPEIRERFLKEIFEEVSS